MRRLFELTLTTAAAAMIAACGGGEKSAENVSSENASGTIDEAPAVPLVNAKGEIIGGVRGGDGDEGATLMIEARGLPPGEHGLHIHDVGICEAPAFTSAGPHWNPTGAQHGSDNPKGAHMGDLKNVTVGEDGNLRVEISVPGSYLRKAGSNSADARQILDSNGAAVVVHAKADDYRTDPSGDAGDRIACAVLGDPAAAGPASQQ